ncbi:MAG: hypothetical protein K940chlam8_01167 [Chlamydiae bacterium]|nr:hypothetical protein [Chlamydiota bacterium]
MNHITRNVLSGATVGALSGLTPYKLDKNIIYSVAIWRLFWSFKRVC